VTTKIKTLQSFFQQLEAWDNRARQPVNQQTSQVPDTSDTPLERNIQSYQSLTSQIRDLAEGADEAVLNCLVTYLQHTNGMVQSQAIAALGYTGSAAAVEPLVMMMRQSTSYDTQAALAQSLGLLGSRSATTAMVEFLQSEMRHKGEAKVRFACAQALSFIADPMAVDPLIGTLTRDYGDFEPYVADLREAARDALVSINTEAVVDRLIDVWQLPQIHPVEAMEESIRSEIVTAFGQLGEAKALEFLLSLAHHQDSLIREMVMSALAYRRDESAVEVLLNALGDGDADVRDAAAFSLQRLGKYPTSSE
jgi:HEAT repeat protein